MVRHHPDKFVDHKHCVSGHIMFLITICLKDYVNLLVEAPHGNSAPCHARWLLI